jgi:hypothetical protein
MGIGEQIFIESGATSGIREFGLQKSGISTNALKGVKKIFTVTANEFTDSIKEIEVMPSTVELEFGISIKSDAGAIIASRSDEATFKVRIVWESNQK